MSEPVICGLCGHKNPPGSMRCGKCKQPWSLEAVRRAAEQGWCVCDPDLQSASLNNGSTHWRCNHCGLRRAESPVERRNRLAAFGRDGACPPPVDTGAMVAEAQRALERLRLKSVEFGGRTWLALSKLRTLIGDASPTAAELLEELSSAQRGLTDVLRQIFDGADELGPPVPTQTPAERFADVDQADALEVEAPPPVSINVDAVEHQGVRGVRLVVPAGGQSIALQLAPDMAIALGKTLIAQAQRAQRPGGLVLPG